jgi:hypothetical protein
MFERLAEYNPKLVDLTPATRVAYAKFKTKMLISQAHEGGDGVEGKNLVKAPCKKQHHKTHHTLVLIRFVENKCSN